MVKSTHYQVYQKPFLSEMFGSKYVESFAAAFLVSLGLLGAGGAPGSKDETLHAHEKARKRGIHPGFETVADVTRSPRQRYQWLHRKDLCPPKN